MYLKSKASAALASPPPIFFFPFKGRENSKGMDHTYMRERERLIYLWQRVQYFKQIPQHPRNPIASPLRLLISARIWKASWFSGLCLSHTKAPLAFKGHIHTMFVCIPVSGNQFLNNSLLLQALIN